MKKILSISIIILMCNIGGAQQNTFNKDAELQRFVERGGKVEQTSPNIYKLTYRDGTQRVFNFNTAANQNSYVEGFDSTIINVWEIDTTLYAEKFKFWQKVDFVSNSAGETAPIDDINNNGLLEYYGPIRISPPFIEPVDIWEQNSQGVFHKVYTYDSASVAVLGIGDVNSDGIKEVYVRTRDTLNGKFYKADSLGAFPSTFDFIFYYYPNIIGNEAFGDFDKNGVTDFAFIDGSNPSRIMISEFRDSINNFTTMFNMPTEGDNPAGFAINDFDGDDKTELVVGTGLHGVHVIEAEDTNQYSVVWNGPAPSVNAYMLTETNDIDGNGKPEFWVGGMDFTTGISTFWCYVSDGDNSYIPVAGIELRYLVSLFSFYLQAADMDNDGVEELIINIGNHLLLLKFTGKPNQHNYDIFYAKIGEATQPGAMFLPSTIRDFNADSKKDILLSLNIYPPPSMSYILVQDKITSVSDDGLLIPDKFDLSQNYPNPFNPVTTISYSLAKDAFVTLKVYDILGAEAATLVNERKTEGNHSVDFNAGNLPSGIYVYKLTTGTFTDIKKLILLK